MTTKNDRVAENDKDEIVNVQLHEKDLVALIQLLNLSKDMFDNISQNSIKLEDNKAVLLYAQRAQLATAFSQRLNSFIDFAEPKSKELH